MAQYDIPIKLLDKLKCALCYEYLSYPPITLYAETGSVCGRCPTLEAEKNMQPLREKNYENVASMLTFPCRYKSCGCMEFLTIQQMPIHEQICTFKPYFCPILPLGSCAWQGAPNELHAHFAMNHQIMLLEDPTFEFDTTSNYKEHFLVPILDELFLLRTEFNNLDNKFKSSVHLIAKPQEVNNFEYALEFSAGVNSDKLWTHPKKQVETDLDLMNRTNECTVELPMLRAVLEEPTVIICKLKIIRLNLSDLPCEDNGSDFEPEELFSDDDLIEIETDDKKKFIKKSRSQMLDDIECPVCQEYMVAPIFQCLTGHSVCGECKPLLKECSICRGEIGNTRNFSLEKVVENLDYSCKNHEDGCKFEGTSSNIRKHELECKYKPDRCPLWETVTCDWMGRMNKAYGHAKSAHPNSIQNNAMFETNHNPACSRFEELKLKSEHGKTFRIRYSYCNDMKQISCTVQCLAPVEECSKFMYEISVVDNNKTGLELKSKKYCGSWGDTKDDVKHCTMWHMDMVKPFFGPNQLLKMRCVINKV